MNMKKIFRNTVGALLLAVGCAAGAFAASSAPRLELQETGIDHQYSITFRNWSSEYYAVEFDLEIDQKDLEVSMNWADTLDSSHRKLDLQKTGDKTVLKFYYDKRTPISNSDSARIGEITLRNLKGNAHFSTSGKIKLADSIAQKTEFSDMKVSLVSRPSGGSSGGSGGSGGSGSSGGIASPMIEWNDVKTQVKVGDDGVKRLSINLKENPRLAKEILQELKNGKILATLQYGDYQWEIDGASIKELPKNRRYYDLSVEKISLKNLSAAVEHSDILQFETSFKGSIPFTATLLYPVGAQYADETVYVSHYNEQDGTLSYLTDAKVDAKGKLKASLTRLDKHAVTLRNFWSVEPAAPENGDTVKPTTPPPSTGQPGGNLIVPGLDSQEMEQIEQEEKEELEELESSQSSEPSDSSATETSGESKDENRGSLHIILIAAIVLVVLAGVGAVIYLQMNADPRRRGR